MDQHEPAFFGHMKARQYTLKDGLAGMLIEGSIRILQRENVST